MMTLPLIEYLRATTTSKMLSLILAACMAACVISVIGSYSRGAYIAMAAIGVFYLRHARYPLLYLAVAGVMIYFVLNFMPQSFFDRVSTISSAQSDESFHGRVVAWQVAYRYAVDHFPFGAGFYGPQLAAIFHAYFPGEESHAAHSIYFQVLGEHGFIGLGLYVALMLAALKYCWSILRKTKGMKDLWQNKLTRIIQTSLLAFFVGGAALSMAYYDLFVILLVLLPQIAGLLPEKIKVDTKWRAQDRPGPDLSPAPAMTRSPSS